MVFIQTKSLKSTLISSTIPIFYQRGHRYFLTFPTLADASSQLTSRSRSSSYTDPPVLITMFLLPILFLNGNSSDNTLERNFQCASREAGKEYPRRWFRVLRKSWNESMTPAWETLILTFTLLLFWVKSISVSLLFQLYSAAHHGPHFNFLTVPNITVLSISTLINIRQVHMIHLTPQLVVFQTLSIIKTIEVIQTKLDI